MALGYINLGATETGKTTGAIDLAEEFLKKSRIRTIFANDKQKEEKYRINKNIQLYQGSQEGWERLLFNTNEKAFCTFFIVDEAGDWYPKSMGKASVKEPPRAKRFNGNVYCFNFHDVNEVPIHVWRFSDFVIVRKTTGDDLKKLRNSLSGKQHIVDAWVRAMNSRDPYYSETLRIHLK